MAKNQRQSVIMASLPIRPVRVEEKGSGLSAAIRCSEGCYCSRRHCMVKIGMQRANVGMDEDDVFIERVVQLVGGIRGTVSTQYKRVQFLSFSFSRNC
jgi:hypothetical protein